MTLHEVTAELLQSNIPPGKLSEHRLWLSAHYSYLAQKMEEVLIHKPTKWMDIRKHAQSDKQADMEWEQTEEGQIEFKCKWQMKATDKLLSGINSRLRTMENEARNQY